MFKDENRHYSLRKLSVGLASVLIGISFASSMNGNSVKADTVNSGSNDAQTVVKGSDAVVKTDAKDDTNAIESNTESAPKASKKDPNAIAQDIKQKAMKASEDVTKMQGAAEKTTKGNAPEAAAKNTTDGSQIAAESTNLTVKQQNTTVKGSADAEKDDSSNVAENDSLTAKNNAVKATVEAAKQGLETPAVPHSDGNETALNVKDGNAITENMLKEGKDNQAGVNPVKSKLKLATLMAIAGKKLNAQMLSESKVMSPTKDTNGGFDSSWGTLNVNDWKGSVQGDYYQLTDYTGDGDHVIVPNEADFAKAGISTSGKQVGVTSSLMKHIFKDKTTFIIDATVAFSKTNNKMVKAIGSDWSHTWANGSDSKAVLSKFDGTNLDVSNVIDMSSILSNNQISDLSSLANWNVAKVTNMNYMLNDNKITNLSPLVNWNVSNVTDMHYMFTHNQISDLSPLANWKVDQVTDMSKMFYENQISDLSPLANWNVFNVTDMGEMFSANQISNLNPLANWKVDNVKDMSDMFLSNHISDLSPLANWKVDKVTNMSGMLCNNQISNVSPLANWKVDNVTDMSQMFEQNHISDLSPLADWNVNNVTDMSYMFCDNKISDLSPLANWDTSKVTNMHSMFENTPLKTVKLTNWDFSNIDRSFGAESIFPDTNFEVTLSDKTSKSLLDIASKLSDPAKENLKEIYSAPIVDGVPDVNGEIQDYLDSIKQKKDEYQQQLDNYKNQIDHYKKELADPNADAAAKENNQHELEQAEQKYQSYLTGDGKKEYDEQLQDLQGDLEDYKQELQQQINQVKLQAEYPLTSLFGNLSKITTPSRDLLVYLVGKLPVKSDAATRTIEITFPDGTKKTINQSIGYGKYVISGTADMATHKLDMAMLYELSKWEPIKKDDGSYDLVKAHVDKNGVASFDDIQLPQIPGYKTFVKTVASPVNPARALFAVSFMALPKPVAPAINDTKPAETVTPEAPATTEVAEPIKTELKVVTSAAKVINLSNDVVATTPKVIDLSDEDDAVTVTPKEATWQVADEPDQDTYRVSNDQYAVELPRISNAQLHVIVNNSTKDSVLFTYKGQNDKYVFNIKFINGHYLLTTYKIKSGKLVKLIDYNFVKASKMIDVILDWINLK